MTQPNYSQAYLRKRKMLLVLPILVIPFLTFLFWSMGGGKSDNKPQKTNQTGGLNLNLPDAKFKEDKLADKLSFYDKADKDSIKFKELIENDPYYKKDSIPEVTNELEKITQTTANKYNQRLNTSPYDGPTSSPDQKIMQKLSVLQKEMNRVQDSDRQDNPYTASDQHSELFSRDVERLENMMKSMSKGGEGDPEISQLNTTLDKIMDVQNPDRVRERIKEKSALNKDAVFAVTRQSRSIPVMFLSKNGNDTPRLNNSASAVAFYNSHNSAGSYDQGNAIEAVVHETQTLTTGSIVKLRLLSDIYINSVLIPKDNFVFGIATLNGERLEIFINYIRNGNSLFPVKLEVFDLDGMPGIFIPGAISRDVAKQSADNSIQTMELATLSPSVAAQATTAGINTVKSLLSRKIKLIKVTAKAGYKVLLRDDNQHK